MGIISVFLNEATINLITEDIEDKIIKYADKYGLERALIHAIALQESDKYYAAIRFEPHLRRAKWYRSTLPDKYIDDKYAYCSIGIMQILYGIARSEGFRGSPQQLFEPEYGIKYGCKYIKTLIGRYYYLDKVISAYNQGTPKKEGGLFKNQQYVDSVLSKYRAAGGSN